jgi:hypothetical protein
MKERKRSIKITGQRTNNIPSNKSFNNTLNRSMRSNTPKNPMNIDHKHPNGQGIFSPLLKSDRKIINQWKRIRDNEDIVISFVSDPPGTTFYSDKIVELTEKIRELGYDYIITHFENDREYHQNCCFKPQYIYEKITETEKNIIWIDGDTNLKKDLQNFNNKTENYDIGLVTYTGNINGFVASPIYVRNTNNSLDLLKDWMDHCSMEIAEGRCELDHDALKHTIIPRKRENLKIKLNWSPSNDLHKGLILENVNSDVPHKRIILRKMEKINSKRPFILNDSDFNIIR